MAEGQLAAGCNWHNSGVAEFKTIHHCTALLFLARRMAMGSGSQKEDSLGQIHSYNVILNCKNLG